MYKEYLSEFLSYVVTDTPQKPLPYVKIQNIYNQLWDWAITNDEKTELLKLYVFTRDIFNGLGLYTLSYYLLETLTYHTYETKRISFHEYKDLLTNQWKGNKDQRIEPYGSWKDVKKFLTFFANNEYSPCYFTNGRDAIIDSFIITFVIPQMVEDRKHMSIQKPITLCGKWLPRERSKQDGWLAKRIAVLYYRHTICMNHTLHAMYKHYRKLIAQFNQYLQVPQVHMCRNEWDKIQFHHVSMKTICKFRNAFFNSNRIYEPHRMKCTENLQEYLKHQIHLLK